MKLLQIGMDVYPISTPEEIIDMVKSVVIHHQGQLNTIKIMDNNEDLKEQGCALVDSINEINTELNIVLRRQDSETFPDGAYEYLIDEEKELRDALKKEEAMLESINKQIDW